MSKMRIVYFQSGGPTAVINSSLCGVVREAKKHPNEIEALYGSLYGVEGLIDDNLVDLFAEDEKDINLLTQTPGQILHSSRYKLPKDFNDPVFGKIMETLKKHNINGLLVNGGNDSMNTCMRLSHLAKEKGLDLKVMGVPKTVDNDLMGTDFALGFPSAALYVMNALKSLILDVRSYKKGKVLFVEIMGRDTGWLTASADALPEDCRPDFILLPEVKLDQKKFYEDLSRVYLQKGYAVVALSEGIDIGVQSDDIDAFGHAQLEGVAYALQSRVKEDLHLPTRVTVLSTSMRASSILASEVDIEAAIACGEACVKALLEGKSGMMAVLKRTSSAPYAYKIEFEPFEMAADAIRYVPEVFL
ncbi:MAG: diphosphate--fructose-6-phosphate 1-phosphotransferase, partial [Bacilli bacterium]|nr:diphosphate--fructose-6-phosphate 1-phosphotransferase [Bacilli bacterium]